jgi:conjugative element/phage-associated large polyvalent protein
MTAPRWSDDNPFLDQQPEVADTFSDDNPFAEKAPSSPVAVAAASVEPPSHLQSDFLAGFGGALTGQAPKSFGTFLKMVGLEELGTELIEQGGRNEIDAAQYGAKAPHWRDVNSISDAIDFVQFQVGSGIGSTAPSLAGGAAGFAVGGPIGAAVGAIATSYMQNTGDIKQELDQLDPTERKGLALALGVPVALLDVVTPVDLINRIVAKKVAKEAARGLLKQGVRSAASEGVTETAQEMLQYGGARAGTDKPVSLQEMMERGFEGGLGGVLTGGVLGAGASVVGQRAPAPPQVRDPVTLKPPADPTQEPTAEEKATRQREVDELVAQEKATAEKKAASQNALLRAANAWNTLTPDQRRAVVTGLANDQYNVRWKDLTKEAKQGVRTALGATSDTNLYTSQEGQQPVPMVPSAPGETAPPAVETPGEAPASEAAPAHYVQFWDKLSAGSRKHYAPEHTDKNWDQLPPAIQQQVKQKIDEIIQASKADIKPRMPENIKTLLEIGREAEKLFMPSDVASLSMQQIEDERRRAASKLTQLAIDAEGGPATAEGNRLEREFWTKYLSDLNARRAQILAPGGEKQQASAAKLAEESIADESQPDITGGQEHIGKRFTHPDFPEMRAIITKNTKKGEKPYRVSYFKVDEKGKPQTYLHNVFDTAQEAYEFITGPADPKLGKGDNLKGFTEQSITQDDRQTAVSSDVLTDRSYYETPGARELAHRVREGDASAIKQMAAEMADRLPKDAVIIPVPSHTGEATHTLKLAEELSRLTGRPVADVVKGINRQSVFDAKKAGVDPKTIKLGLELKGELPTGTPVFIDNVVDTQTTFDELKKIIPNAKILSHSKVVPGTKPPDTGAQPNLPAGGPAPQAPSPEGAPTTPEGKPTPGPEGAIGTPVVPPKSPELEEPTTSHTGGEEEFPGGIEPDRLAKIEQSIEDKTQVEKLINEPPANTLETAYRSKLESSTLDQLDEMIDAADKAFEEGKISEADFRTVLNDIADAKKALKAKQAGPPPAPLKFKMPDTIGKDLNKFDEDQLKNVKRAIAQLLQSPDIQSTPQHKILKEELNRIFDYESERREKNKNFLKDESGELRFTGWKLPSLRRKAVKTAARSGLPHYEQALAERIGLEEDPVNPYTVSDWFRKKYSQIFRHGAPIGSAERLSGKKLKPHESPYVFAQMSSRFLTQAEEYLRGQGPFIPDDQGGFVPTGTPPLSQISAMVGDDVERLGWLALARRELYERATRNRTIGLDPVASKLMYTNTPKAYHDAADKLAQYNHDLASYAVWGGLITEETRAKFDTLFYAPIRRIFGSEVEGSASQTVTPRGKRDKSLGGENPIKRFRGSRHRMANPIETTVDMTARVIRASNQNKVAELLVKLAKDNPDAYKGVLEPASAAIRNKIKSDLKAKAEQAKAEAAEDGVELTTTEAERFIGTLGDEALAIRDNVLNVWVDGKLEHWVMHPELAYGMKSLTPHEYGMLVRAASKPADVQRAFIVNDPTFIMTMAMVDTFQAFVNTKYGFTPVLDSFKGWWAAVHNTPAFAEYRRGGGGQSSLTSRQYGRSQTSLHDIVGASSDQTPVAQAIQQLRTYHPLEAWRTLVAPVAEAARVGEYLNARGRGASVIEAVYAAKTITGNYSLQGGEWYALNRMAVFLNPALQVLDTTTRVIARNPVSWFMKSSILGGAAFILYMANADDDDIRELRQTQGGQRYFFFRLPNGSIAKIRKPFLEGAIFASGVEAALDKMRGDNPEAFQLWQQAVIQELKVNLLPTIGVIPAQLWANKDWLSGAPIRPEANELLEPMFQARASTGAATRIIGKATNTSPAVIEWLTRSQFGILGSQVLSAIEGAIDFKQSGEWPIAEELPFVQRVLVRFPSTNTASIRNFYDRAKKVERVAETIEYMAMNEPEMLEAYVDSHQEELALIDVFKDTRAQLADFRKAIEDVSTAESSVVAPSDKRQFTDEFLRVMIETAKSANLMHQAVTETTAATSVP